MVPQNRDTEGALHCSLVVLLQHWALEGEAPGKWSPALVNHDGVHWHSSVLWKGIQGPGQFPLDHGNSVPVPSSLESASDRTRER